MSQRGQYSDRLGRGKIICFDGTHDKYFLLKKLSSVSSEIIVYKAELHFPDDDHHESPSSKTNNYVVLKMIPLSLRDECEKLQLECKRSYGAEDHSNILGIKKWFCIYKDGYVGVEMPYMDEGSLRHIVSTRFNNGGLPEDCIAVALREALLGLSFIHGEGRVHKRFSAANIFVNGGNPDNNTASVKLAFEASMYKVDHQEDGPGGSSSSTSAAGLDLKEITKWAAAPEVYGGSSSVFYGPKADIWLVGITALELAYGGCLSVANREDLEAIIKNITKKHKLPVSFGNKLKKVKIRKGKKVKTYLQKKVKAAFRIKTKAADAGSKEKEEDNDDERQRVFSKDFEKMVAMCLAKKPEKRPTADELLQTNFFRNSNKDINHFMRILLSAKEKIAEEEEGRN